MKTLKQILQEKLDVKNIKTNNHKQLKQPVLNTTAYDYNGEPWEIIATCPIIDYDKPHTISSLLKYVVKKYDSSGYFMEWIENEFDINSYIKEYGEKNLWAIGAIGEHGETAVFLWGPEGLYYKD